MKTRIFLLIGLLLSSYSNTWSQEAATGASPAREGTINVSCSPALYNLAETWAAEYGRLNPKITIAVTKSGDAGIAGMLKAGNGIGIVSKESDPALHMESARSMVVGRDVIVTVMHPKNPFMDEITRKGISPDAFAGIFQNPEKPTWGALLGNGSDVPVHCYMVNDASVIAGVSEFVKIKQGLDNITTVESGAEMIAAIGKDPEAIGFCRMVTLTAGNAQFLPENILLLPIDRNGNGKIDYMEKIYDDLQAFSRGVWIGKYPKALSGNIYAITAGQSAGENEKAFLAWVLTEGQQFLDQQGFSNLVSGERQTQIDKLNYQPATAATGSAAGFDLLKVALLVFMAAGALFFIIGRITKIAGKKKSATTDNSSGSLRVFDENSVVVPKGLYFDRTHTWAFMEQDGMVKVGIDDFLQHLTGPLTRVEMKNPWEKVKKGDRLFTMIRNGKQLHVYSPVSGTIIKQNKALVTDASILNAAPYTAGWVYMIEPANWMRDIEFLTMAEKHRTWLKEELARVRDFLTAAIQAHVPEFAPVTLQDGGALRDNILADLGPRIWEDFQTKFIDTAR